MLFDTDDYNLISLASSSASLDESPKKNWVENSGGLPPYVRKIARGVMKSGKTKAQAIAIAISRIKKWAAGGDDVDADTQAKAAKALAQWTALKAKNKTKNVVKASHETGEYLMLSYIPSFKLDSVRDAWNAKDRARRHESLGSGVETTPYTWVKEVWTDFIIVEEEESKEPKLVKYPYTVHPFTKEVTFGEPVRVATVYVELDDSFTDTEKRLLSDFL